MGGPPRPWRRFVSAVNLAETDLAADDGFDPNNPDRTVVVRRGQTTIVDGYYLPGMPLGEPVNATLWAAGFGQSDRVISAEDAWLRRSDRGPWSVFATLPGSHARIPLQVLMF